MLEADFFLTLLPIALLVFLMTKKNAISANRALPLSALLLYLILLGFFPLGFRLVNAAVIAGLLTALTPIAIVLGAIFLFKTMEKTGAMTTVRQWLNGITDQPVAQIMIVAWAFSFLIEGVSGFGTPAALAAPLLVGLGFSPLKVVVVCLMMDSVPVTFGAVGMPTWFGLGGLAIPEAEMREIGFKASLLHLGGAVLIPVWALRMIVSWREIRESAIYLILVIGGTMATYVAVAAVSLEFPSIAGGLVGLFVSILLARFQIGLKKSEIPHPPTKVAMRDLFRASFPLWGTVLVLLVTRLEFLKLKGWLTNDTPALGFGLSGVGDFRVSDSLVITWRDIIGSGLDWSHAFLYVPSILPFALIAGITFLLFRSSAQEVVEVGRESLIRILKPIGAFLGALVLVKLLTVGGENSAANVLGQGLASIAGENWQFVAVFLGALGAFFSGSSTVSNLTFGAIQEATAASLGLDRSTILALQLVGSALGNMVCIHNIVAVCSILGLAQSEGLILKKTFPTMLCYAAVVTLLALLF